MARPSRQLDQALLRSGRALLPEHGCTGLTQRLLARHAGVQPGMFHYHFASKDAFLQTLLQQLYDEMFARLADGVAGDGPALERLRRGLIVLGRFAHEHHALLGRLLADAIAGLGVVRAFLRANAPRHLALLLGLLHEAERQGALPPAPPLQRLTFLLGATVAPMLVAPGVMALGLPLADALGPQVLDDAALAQRVDLALQALRHAAEERG